MTSKYFDGQKINGRKILKFLYRLGKTEWYKVQCIVCKVEAPMSSNSITKISKKGCNSCYRKEYARKRYGRIK